MYNANAYPFIAQNIFRSNTFMQPETFPNSSRPIICGNVLGHLTDFSFLELFVKGVKLVLSFAAPFCTCEDTLNTKEWRFEILGSQNGFAVIEVFLLL